MTTITRDTKLYVILADPMHQLTVPRSLNRFSKERGMNAALVRVHVDVLAAFMRGADTRLIGEANQ